MLETASFALQNVTIAVKDFREIVDIAQPGDRILLVSYGSGAGSDAISLHTTEALLERRDRAPFTQDYIARRTEIDYATYARYRGKLNL